VACQLPVAPEQEPMPLAIDKSCRQIKFTNTAKADLPVFQASRRLTFSIENLSDDRIHEVYCINKIYCVSDKKFIDQKN
jgi:hypothetical protein